ncbi:proline-rich receptor-like protein kinase PERK2 [Drosophila innubila]|uniref:proline-rich receptor-like protein kinase PERK2 n=1 Tax=Drosophila innubila TaxID=198719 RepID=UPI00148D5530|nr:proline-rich receptor-like protein kinase PERK2 [Drosophila innubila]
MFAYQVVLLPWLLLGFKFATAQSPQNSVNVQCATYTCNPPYVLQNGLCVGFNTSQCGSGSNIIVNVFPPGSSPSYQLQPNQVVVPCAPAQSQPCPNQPFVPYPPIPSQPCPNQPVSPSPPVLPQPCPNQPVSPNPPVQPCPNQPVLPSSPEQLCPNQPVPPSPPVLPQPCPNQPVTPYPPVQPSPNQPVSPNSPVQPCPNQPVTPYPPVQPQPTPSPNQPNLPNSPVQPCPNQPVTPYPPVQPQPTTNPNQHNPPIQSQPCPNQPVAPNPPVQPVSPNPPLQPQPAPYPDEAVTSPVTDEPTPIPTVVPQETSTSTTPTPIPAPILRCPTGTVLVNGFCRLIYCGSGVYSYARGRCVMPRCPQGTVWTGQKCAPPQPIELDPIHIERTIMVEKSKNTSDLVVNNVQNLVVNASLVIPTREDDYDDDYSEEIDSNQAATTTKCCTVVAPRICRCPIQSTRWQCFNRRQYLCGDFCSTSKVVLKPSNVSTWIVDDAEMLLMPPNWNFDCRNQDNCITSTEKHDCSGCALGLIASCSSYCYNYHCDGPNCGFYDQEEFCKLAQFSGSVVCRPEDAWKR